MVPNNRNIVKEIKQAVQLDMNNRMSCASRWLIEDAERMRLYTAFTGNTLTSYAAAVLIDGEVADLASSNEHLAPPVRKKVEYGKKVHLSNPYEGPARTVKGEVPTGFDFGYETSIENIQGYNSNSEFAIFVTSGTEYSEYLEYKENGAVLGRAFTIAKDTLCRAFKSIPKL